MSDEAPITWYTGDHPDLSLAPPVAPTIAINSDSGRPLVTIHPNGTLEYGEGYDPDDAARRFWDALRVHMPNRCPNCGHTPGKTAPTEREGRSE